MSSSSLSVRMVTTKIRVFKSRFLAERVYQIGRLFFFVQFFENEKCVEKNGEVCITKRKERSSKRKENAGTLNFQL